MEAWTGPARHVGAGARGRRCLLLAALLLVSALGGPAQALPPPGAGPGLLPDVNPPLPVHQAAQPPDGSVDPGLEALLQLAAPDQPVEVVVQFHGSLEPADLQLLSDLGFTIRRTFHVVPAAFVVGTPEAIDALALHPRTYWIEHNAPTVLYMDLTTTVTNATGVWSTHTLSKLQREGPPFSGEGVTAAIVDTGVDAGHPDLDYGEKMIANMKSNFDGTFTDVEDGDTGSGHGTHVAGTIAGNGDASGGARSGMAKDATMVAVSTGEAFLQNVVGALEWVFDHSRPGNNPWNVRVVSNSWGSGAGEYDPQDSVSLVANRLSYENNVVVVFAAGNSGGDGSEIQTSVYGNTPVVVQVAAATHDGTGLAGFSSRGQDGLNQTYPDIAAPGVKIWATQARRTSITASTNTDPGDLTDPYYMAISGTSMATPHVSGMVAMLFDAAPSLRISDVHENYAGEDPAHWNNTETRIHEVEYILELTADRMTGEGVPGNASNSSSHYDRPYDFAQGYGIINATRAVALALTLEELRVDDPTTNVSVAWDIYERLHQATNVTQPTDTVQTGWLGEWGRLNDDRTSLVSTFPKQVFVPNDTTTLVIDFTYAPARSDGWAIASLALEVDSDGDGSADWTTGSGYSNRGSRHAEVEASTIGPTGTTWSFLVTGQAVGTPPIRSLVQKTKNQYSEILIEYQIGVLARLGTGNGTVRLPPQEQLAAHARWDFGPASPDGGNATVEMERHYWNLSQVTLVPQKPDADAAPAALPWWLLPLLVAAAAVVAVVAGRKHLQRALRRGPLGRRRPPQGPDGGQGG